MEQAITAVGKGKFNGVYAANDGTAGGAIAAMKAAGIDPKTIPTTGQDAELAAIQRILAGDQFMTVYKPIKPLPTRPRVGRGACNGKTLSDANSTENNGSRTFRRSAAVTAGRRTTSRRRSSRTVSGRRPTSAPALRIRLPEVRHPVRIDSK